MPRTARAMPAAALCLAAALAATGVAAGPALAQEASPLRVGVKEAPPFVVAQADGSWSGLALELWRQVAEDMGVAYELVPLELDPLLHEVGRSGLDVAVAALTVTAEREAQFDFSHPYYASGLAVAVRRDAGGSASAALRALFSLEFLRALAALTLVLLAAGALVWWFERRRNAAQFGGGTAQGLGSGFWWAAVTMTTVGYGDKAPVTAGGRLVALVWMFASIITISGFTAAIATTLTVSRLESNIRTPEDLVRVDVGAVEATTAARYLADRRIGVKSYASPDAALEGLAAGEVEAVVYDEPLLRYRIHGEWQAVLALLPFSLERQDYALALPPGSELREPVNRALLRVLASDDWNDTRRRYLGDG